MLLMDRIIFATGNEGKLREIRMILKDLNIPVVSLKEAGIHADIAEDGKTFEENALIKARTIAQLTGEAAMADDSGLEIDYLNGEPGVYSARYCGRDTSYRIKNRNILERLTDVPDELRSARFVCAVALAIPAGLLPGVDEDTIRTVRGTMEGRIGYEEKGEHGFGYDPIFYLPELSCYSGELLPEKKNEISHRGKALRMMKKVLEDYGI